MNNFISFDYSSSVGVCSFTSIEKIFGFYFDSSSSTIAVYSNDGNVFGLSATSIDEFLSNLSTKLRLFPVSGIAVGIGIPAETWYVNADAVTSVFPNLGGGAANASIISPGTANLGGSLAVTETIAVVMQRIQTAVTR